jgi:hypothetical protein
MYRRSWRTVVASEPNKFNFFTLRAITTGANVIGVRNEFSPRSEADALKTKCVK